MPSALPDPRAPLRAGSHRAFPAVFAQNAARTPDRLAVEDDARRFTYAELRTRSNRIAQWLRARGIGADDVVAIHAERNAFTVCAVLGILQSGAAFVLI